MLDAVNRTNPRLGDKVVVFGAGPIGLGAVLGYRRRGVANIVVVDIIPSRLEKALQVGADAVINSAEEDVAARLVELHGDGAGAPAMPALLADVAAHGATFGVVAVHKRPVEVVVIFGEA